MEEMELVAVRIKDGIFAGNVAAAEDREFLGMNKITHIINCAGGEVADFFVADPELRYLSFPWKDTAGSVCTTVLFDPNDENVNKTVQFIDEAMASGDCVLVHSYHGVSRSPALIAAYCIVKYGWKLESAMSFLQMAHPDVNIKPHFLRQLRLFAKRHQVERDIFDRNIDDTGFGLDNDQWMLRNTLLNGLTHPEQEANELYHACTTKIDVGTRVGKLSSKKARISFIDTKQGTTVDPPNSTPLVPGKPSGAVAGGTGAAHVDPNAGGADSFIGSQGPSVLRTGRRSPSILSRTTSPCSRQLESDPSSNPKGRQELKALPSASRPVPPAGTTSATNAAVATPTAAASASTPSKATQSKAPGATEDYTTPAAGNRRTSNATATPDTSSSNLVVGARELSVESNQGRLSYYERLAPPKPKPTGTAGSSGSNGTGMSKGTSTGLPARNPLATLTSKHKYRNGSPLPLVEDKQKGERKGRTAISSSPSSRPASGGAPTSPRGVRSTSASSKERTVSPGSASSGSRAAKGGAPSPSGSSRVTREATSRYVAIAPQRSGSASGRSAWNSSLPDHARPTVTRPLSPAYQPSSPSAGAGASSPGAARRRSGSVRSRTSSAGDKERTRKRSTSKQKKRTGSPGKGAGTPSRAPPSPSNLSVASGTERTASPGEKGGRSPGQGKLRRQPPAAIPSRRQQ